MVTSQANDVVTFFLMVAVILAAARVCGECALKLKQPAIIGELLAGILLGPALLSSVSVDHPLWQPGRNSRALEGLLLISVILLLFVAGMEVEFSHLPRNGSRIALTSAMGFILPFLVGVIGAYWLPLGAHQASNPLFAFFFGTALTISSLPVIARILLDLGLLKNEVGGIIMMSAMVDDLIGWILLSVLLTLSTTDSHFLTSHYRHDDAWCDGSLGAIQTFNDEGEKYLVTVALRPTTSPPRTEPLSSLLGEPVSGTADGRGLRPSAGVAPMCAENGLSPNASGHCRSVSSSWRCGGRVGRPDRAAPAPHSPVASDVGSSGRQGGRPSRIRATLRAKTDSFVPVRQETCHSNGPLEASQHDPGRLYSPRVRRRVDRRGGSQTAYGAISRP
ncbi:MAG: hypothetical protein OJF50_006669 [Nitrospira sp.]|jgi:hypothetical protein|nr:hypothetical protein [Nitrospira sp.]